jgi:hypothetical protein
MQCCVANPEKKLYGSLISIYFIFAGAGLKKRIDFLTKKLDTEQ